VQVIYKGDSNVVNVGRVLVSRSVSTRLTWRGIWVRREFLHD